MFLRALVLSDFKISDCEIIFIYFNRNFTSFKNSSNLTVLSSKTLLCSNIKTDRQVYGLDLYGISSISFEVCLTVEGLKL